MNKLTDKFKEKYLKLNPETGIKEIKNKINEKIITICKITDLKIDKASKQLLATLELIGEKDPLHAKLYYEIVEENNFDGKIYFLLITHINTSKTWLNSAYELISNQQKFEKPKFEVPEFALSLFVDK